MGVLAGRVSAVVALVAAILAVSAFPAAAATPPAKPAQGALRLTIPDAFVVGGHLVTVPGRVVHVDGVVRPYVPGQTVLVKALLGSRQFKIKRVAISPAPGAKSGRFSVALSSPGAGQVTVQVGHTRTATLSGLLARRGFAALAEQAGFGSRGPFVELIQQRLAALHFYIPQTGVYDSGTGLAIDAYHRLLHWGTYQTLDGRTVSYLLDGFGEFKLRFPSHGRHAEGNLSLQLLALADGSHVYQIYPISSGKPSTPTILGDFHVYSKVPGYLPDGMYFSNFFISGYAIHGYNPAPDYPASHGCMRVPIPDALSIFDWLQIGNWVDVYY
ncbi:MAG: L,D-transpeptidase family protein [Solirubrobacterales bacterium]|nr:L,D-transpeptidase family protein [Solirubrobacterales bacterium]